MFTVEQAVRLGTKHKYLTKHGRYRWQMDMAQALIADALEKEANDATPWWSRKASPVPCDCKTCHHCKAALTWGIAHPDGSHRRKKPRLQTSPAETPTREPKVRGPVHELVQVSNTSQWCHVCYAHWAAHPQPG
eukprot:SAG11_NODE_8169_length_1052_cov_4.584470_1_plen_134_part_00